MSIFDPNHLEKALDFLSEKDRELVLDALHCDLHNTAGTLDGNTAESDVKWFARYLCDGFHPRGYHWLDENEQRFWDNLAEQCLRGLPMIMSRMAVRYRAYQEVVDVLLKSEWAGRREAKGKQE